MNYSKDIFLERVKLYESKGCKVLTTEYSGKRGTVKFICMCSKEDEVKMPIFLSKMGCDKCDQTRQQGKWSNNRLDMFLQNKNIIRLGNVKTGRIPVKLECSIDNHVWLAKPDSIFQGRGCPRCANFVKHTNDDIDKILFLKNIKRMEEYKGIHRKINFKCLAEGCHHSWSTTPNSVCNFGTGCPLCATGKMEKQVLKIIKNTVKYDTIESHKPLYFYNRKFIPDFYMKFNNNVVIIEYNGRQHYEPTRFNNISMDSAIKNLSKQKKRDSQLRKYCKENNIHLLEIPYWWKEDSIIKHLLEVNNLFK